jgi:hypothetical protein
VSASVAGNAVDNVYVGYVFQNESVGDAYPVNTPDRVDIRVTSDKIELLQNDQFAADKTVVWSLKEISKIV